MSKSVLISIQPKWCELIANGKKTIEVRKTKPKLDAPFKCYIYCTKQGRPLVYGSPCPSYVEENLVQTYGYSKEKAEEIFGCWNGKVIGEFVCDDISKFTAEFTDGKTYEDIRYCYLNEYEEEEEMIVVSNEWSNPNNSWICKESCLSFDDFKKYIGINFHDIPFYGWHISDLKIYDEPKELSEFNKPCDFNYDCFLCDRAVYDKKVITDISGKITKVNNKFIACDDVITRPPQSWCYVEELRDV